MYITIMAHDHALVRTHTYAMPPKGWMLTALCLLPLTLRWSRTYLFWALEVVDRHPAVPDSLHRQSGQGDTADPGALGAR